MNKFISTCNKVLWIGIAFVALFTVVRNFVPGFLEDYRSWNALPAHIATYLFLVTVLPGVLQRMGVVHSLLRLLIAWRRTLGIAMYFFALVHMFFLLDDLPWFSEGRVTTLDIFTATGLFAMIVLLPALLTSNALSIRFFKKYWKVIQRSTYIAIPLIALHLYQSVEIVAASAYGIVAVLIVLSFAVKALKGKTSGIKFVSTTFATILLATGTSFATWTAYTREDTSVSVSQVTAGRPEAIQVDEVIVVSDEVAEVVEDGTENLTTEETIEVVASEPETLFLDGAYSANGVFVTAGGKYTESVDVTLIVEDDLIREMGIVGNITNSKSQRYQDRFEASIDDLVVGKALSEIDVDAVAGASDTTDGFMVALEKIRSEATR